MLVLGQCLLNAFVELTEALGFLLLLWLLLGKVSALHGAWALAK